MTKNKIHIVFILLALSTFAYGKTIGHQPIEASFVFNQLIIIEGEASPLEVTQFNEKFQITITEFANKKSNWNNDKKLLNHVFYKIHRNYLKEYKPLQSFNSLLKSGEYGCLTGTALYAIILEGLGYDYEIIETNNHVYLIIEKENQRFLFESTDPINGFYDDEKEIATILLSNQSQIGKNESSFNFNLDIKNQIGLEELIGLQYYNIAVNSYNQGALMEAFAAINSAAIYYPNERLKVFLTLILKELDQEVQSTILTKEEFYNLAKISAL